MGQFSWLDCQNGSQILDDVYEDSYLLVPREFRQAYDVHIQEHCYDGYGHFGGYDVYDLVAIWNRKFIHDNPDLKLHDGLVKNASWYPFFSDLTLSIEEMLKKWNESEKEITGRDVSEELRSIGIDIACYDEDNASLLYPIKITFDPKARYEWCSPSKSDPDQGWVDF